MLSIATLLWKTNLDIIHHRFITKKTVSSATSRGSGDRVVLGAWNEKGGYIGRAVESDGAFFDTGREVWDLLEQTGIPPWEVNEAYLQEYHKRGFSFEFSSRDIKADDWKKEIEAIIALDEGNLSAALKAIKLTPDEGLTYRMQEVQWLFQNGYDFKKIGDKLIFSIP